MRSFFVHWFITAIALAVTTHFVSSIHVTSAAPLLAGALVLGLVNAFVRPVLTVMTLPLTLMTMGLFYLIVNGVAFGLAAALVPGFQRLSFGRAIMGALLVSLASWGLGWLLRPHQS